MISFLSILPLLILVLLVVGSGTFGLVLMVFINIGASFGTYYATSTEWRVEIPQEKP